MSPLDGTSELFGRDITPFHEAQTVLGDGISEIMVNGKYTISLPFKIELL